MHVRQILEMVDLERYFWSFGDEEKFREKFLDYSAKHLAIVDLCSTMGQVAETAGYIACRESELERPEVKKALKDSRDKIISIRKFVGMEGWELGKITDKLAEIEAMASVVAKMTAYGLDHPYFVNIQNKHPEELKKIVQANFLINDDGITKVAHMLSETENGEKGPFDNEFENILKNAKELKKEEDAKASSYSIYL